EASDAPGFSPGDRVVLNGWGVGESHHGGFAERARVQSSWLVKLPEAITTRQAMAIGTAGYTAMLAVMALEGHGLAPGAGDLVGIESVRAPQAAREAAWQRLARDLDAAALESMTTVVPLADVPAVAERIVAGQVRGRTLVDVRA